MDNLCAGGRDRPSWVRAKARTPPSDPSSASVSRRRRPGTRCGAKPLVRRRPTSTVPRRAYPSAAAISAGSDDRVSGQDGDNEFFSHVTSGLYFGVPLPAWLERRTTLHVSVVAPARPPHTRGVTGHELSFAVVAQWKGFRLADPVTTWCQLAAMLSVDDLVAAGDYLITGPDPLHGLPPFASREDLMAGVAAHGNRRGIRAARRALDLVRVGPRSRPESLLRVLMVTNGFPEPELNLSVRLLNGSHKEPDVVYPAIRFGIEYEGDGHRQDRALFLRDIERKEAFADIDWELMRVTSDHLKHPDELLARIRRRIHRRCLTFGVASPS